MEQIKEVLVKPNFTSTKKFVNRGLGFMTEEERNTLLEIGAIKPEKDIDAVAQDGYCVNVYRNGDATCVFEGSKFDCEMEKDKIKRDKPGIDVQVRRYPKAYNEYYKNKEAKRKALEYEEEANEQLLKEIGF
jgi:hypothetical protein